MDTTVVLQLVKQSIGMNSSLKDNYISNLISGVIDEIVNQRGIVIDLTQNDQLMFVVDYSVWRFYNRDTYEDMPRHLRFRLNELYLHYGGASSV